MSVDDDDLISVAEELSEPLVEFSFDAIHLKLPQKDKVIDLIEGLCVIKIDYICFNPFKLILEDVINMSNQLGQAASTLSESMLFGADEIV